MTDENASTSYLKIQGVLGVSISQEASKPKAEYSLRPLTAYLSPDKKNAVLYGGVKASDEENVKQIQLAGDSIKLTLDGSIQSKEDFLIQLALQQKPVELHVNVETNAAKIVGFTYPTPKP